MRNDIQILRAIAVIAVIIFHYDERLLPGGFIGVDIFFAISGYLITQILLKKKQRDASTVEHLRQFYVARIYRIIPAYYFMLTIVTFISAYLFIEKDFSFFYPSLKSTIFFHSNQFFSVYGSYFAPSAHEQPLLHAWSLAIEMQFYLLFPIVVLLVPSQFIKPLMISSILGFYIYCEYLTSVGVRPEQAYYSLLFRVPEFLVGGLFALFAIRYDNSPKLKSVIRITGLTLIASSILLIDKSSNFPGLLSLFPVLGTCIVIASGSKQELNSKVYMPMAWFGTLSYSLYLWHWPILVLLKYYTNSSVLNSYYTLVFVFLTVLFSAISYYVIEKRFNTSNRPKKRVVKKTALRPLLVLIFTGSCAHSYSQAEHINRIFSPDNLEEEFLQYADSSTICHRHIVDECLRGNLASIQKVLVIGDSHAAMLNHYFDHLGKKLNFKARIISSSNCINIKNFDTDRLASWAQEPCENQIKETQKHLDSSSLIFIAGRWSNHMKSKNFMQSFSDFLDYIDEQNKTLFVFPEVPNLTIEPFRTIRFNHLDIGHLSSAHSRNETYSKLKLLLEKHQNSNLLDLESDKFFENAPYFKNKLIYFDTNHLNQVGAELYAQQTLTNFAAQTGL